MQFVRIHYLRSHKMFEHKISYYVYRCNLARNSDCSLHRSAIEMNTPSINIMRLFNRQTSQKYQSYGLQS